jgi:hypothetical protein
MSHPSTEAQIERIARGLIDRSLAKPEWTHAAHFAAALWLLRHRGDAAVREMPPLIRAYNEETGTANTDTTGYHETITLASLRAARAWLDDRAPPLSRSGVPLQAKFQMALHVGPLAEKDAVHVRIAHSTVLARHVVTDHTVLLRTQRLDRLLRAKIEIVGPQADDPAAERLERVSEQHELAGGIHAASLPTLRIPGVADLDAIDRGHDVVIPRAADDGA